MWYHTITKQGAKKLPPNIGLIHRLPGGFAENSMMSYDTSDSECSGKMQMWGGTPADAVKKCCHDDIFLPNR